MKVHMEHLSTMLLGMQPFDIRTRLEAVRAPSGRVVLRCLSMYLGGHTLDMVFVGRQELPNQIWLLCTMASNQQIMAPSTRNKQRPESKTCTHKTHTYTTHTSHP